MKLPEPQPNTEGCDFEAHTIKLPRCCPVSQNPQPGSTIIICYRPGEQVLEIGALCTYIQQYKGGLKDKNGTIIVRDMEAMIRRIADDCAQTINVPVTVCAYLVLAPRQTMYLFVRRKPYHSTLSI